MGEEEDGWKEGIDSMCRGRRRGERSDGENWVEGRGIEGNVR